MSTKHFCDLCGKPAMSTAFSSKSYRSGENSPKAYHLCVEFNKGSDFHPKTTDERADICVECMAAGLREIATKLSPEV